MLDENEHSRKEDGRSLHRLLHKTEQQDATVEVDSAAFFSELPPEQSAPPPRRPQQNTPRTTVSGENGAYQPPKRGKILLIIQAILSVLALVQLWRTQMLPVLYLVILARCWRFCGCWSSAVRSTKLQARCPGHSRWCCVLPWRWAACGRSRV